MAAVHFGPAARRILGTVLLLTLVLAGCGASSASRPAPTTSLVAPGPVSNAPIDMSADGLHVTSSGRAVSCASPSVPSDVKFDDWLVLATARLTYDAGELQQMRAYLGPPTMEAAPPPDTLQWVQGGLTAQDIGPYLGTIGYFTSTYCTLYLDITNTSADPIQIPQAGLQLDAAPQRNSTQYRLIDVCSLDAAIMAGCQHSQGASVSCDGYDAQIQLGTGSAGQEFLKSPVGLDAFENPCPVLLLSPGAAVRLSLNFGSGQPLIYTGIIELKLQTSMGPRTLALAHVPMTFADPSQFTCYGLQGSTFMQEAKGEAALQGLTEAPHTGVVEECA